MVHCAPAPVLEAVDASLDDVAGLVALLLLVAVVDRVAGLLPAESDRVVACGDRGGDAPGAQASSGRRRRVAFVFEEQLRSGAGLPVPA